MTLPPILFIGGGNMASAIINGLDTDTVSISVADINTDILARHSANGLSTFTNAVDAIPQAKIIVLAVKPQVVDLVLESCASAITTDHIVVSILAGTTSSKLEALLPKDTRVIRCMPNTPIAVGLGMVGLCAGSATSNEDMDIVESLFSSSAATLRVSEDKMNAITAVSGSGPAYFFHFCEVLVSAAQKLGFNQKEAELLVSQTASGSISYLCSQDGFPAGQLREQVTSPGGTTAAALEVFSEANIAALAERALQAAENRGKELE